LLYHEEDVEKRFNQLYYKFFESKNKTARPDANKCTNPKNMTANHLAILRQFSGTSYIIVYASQIIDSISLGDDYTSTPLFINTVQMVANLIGILLVHKYSRSLLLIWSSWLCGIINIIIGIANILQLSFLCFFMMIIFMIPCGGGLNPVAYSIPPEIVFSGSGRYSTVVSWSAIALITIIPPFVSDAIPNGLAYPMFFFFAFYMGVSIFINLFLILPL
jgi:hypothetical protein